MPIESLLGLQRNTKTLRRKSHFISLRSTMKKKKNKHTNLRSVQLQKN